MVEGLFIKHQYFPIERLLLRERLQQQAEKAQGSEPYLTAQPVCQQEPESYLPALTEPKAQLPQKAEPYLSERQACCHRLYYQTAPYRYCSAVSPYRCYWYQYLPL